MYTREELEKYPYFAEKIAEAGGVEGLLDQLTGVISRGYILWFAQWLIDHHIPFTFAMLDLDNFKFINDTYGHHIGDRVLVQVAKDLADYVKDVGIVGRFGGDEFLFINLRDVTYDAIKAFLMPIFDGVVLRKNIHLEECDPFITGTIGCATYPRNAQDYNGLFELIDKTLYRGKSKGRNCHIIYVEEKHKNIEIRKIARRGMYTTFSGMVRQFELAPGLLNKIRGVMPLLMEELQISDLYYVGKQNIMRAVRQQGVEEPVCDLYDLLRSDDMFATNNMEEVRQRCPSFYEVMTKREVETLLVVRIAMDMDTDGYLICAEPRNRRIWQEAECAILYFLAKLLAARIRIDGEKLM